MADMAYCVQTIKQNYMFQYFLKVVSTQFQTIDGKKVRPRFQVTHGGFD